MKQHHLGIACRNIDASCKEIEKIHNVVAKTEVLFDKEQEINVQLLSLEDGTNLELISGKVVAGLLKKNVSLYHVCYEVEDIEFEIKKAVKNGAFLMVRYNYVLPLFGKRKACFLMFPYGLVEFLATD
jgi:methylmalonyl-CoA/ethylmalonyl-CoA epimerase